MSEYPLGIIPRKFWEENRFIDLKEAIKRYLDAEEPIHPLWIEEYNDLVKKQVNKN